MTLELERRNPDLVSNGENIKNKAVERREEALMFVQSCFNPKL